MILLIREIFSKYLHSREIRSCSRKNHTNVIRNLSGSKLGRRGFDRPRSGINHNLTRKKYQIFVCNALWGNRGIFWFASESRCNSFFGERNIFLRKKGDYFLFIPTMIIAIPAMAIATISPITGPK